MKAFIIITFIGCFGVDEGNNIISFKLFPKNPEKIAEKIREAEMKIIDEEKEVIAGLKKRGFKEFIFNFKKPNVRAELGSSAEQFIKNNLRNLAIQYKLVQDQIEFNQLITNVNIELTKEKIRKVFERDSLVIQANNAVEELDKTINILIERLRELYSLHFPELDKAISSHEKFAKIVEELGAREKMVEPELKELAEKSVGAEFREEDIKVAQAIAKQIINLLNLRNETTNYMERNLKEVAPNFTELATPQIAAKLMARAGGLEKIAKMSASAIQLLGAERSLFRYLRGKGRGPRFGILALHPLVQGSSEQHKGRVARAVASKLSIAARIDYYSKKYRADELKKELMDKVKEILG
ncbi:MAG: hypothetical protein QMD14_05770 [Candidatus Aenigmarchaeota archaeon]|nr:hypothetical protein [Candidatus Aenigmarchaeota archaeon]